MMRLAQNLSFALATLCALSACTDVEIEDGETDSFPDGKADGGLEEGSNEAAGVLALVNDPTLNAAALKSAAGITTRVATNIVTYRNGPDGAPSTADDNAFETLRELDAIPYVGPATLNALLEAARVRGLVHANDGTRIDVLFSPQVPEASHNARIAQMIRGAQSSVDIAMYSYSDAGVSAAIADAVRRGVKIRFLFETARKDKGITDPAARAASKSGKLEAAGVDVRYVNKILHHKLAIVDGPRDDASRTATAKLVTGSANWSSTGGTVYDEATFFIENSPELAAAYQAEFDALWIGSRDFEGPAPVQGPSGARVTPASVADEAGIEALFTRANFRPGGSDGATWKVDEESFVVSDEFVDAIGRATKSIHVGSGHLRLRPLAEALVAAKAARPELDIKVYLDQQEWLSTTAQNTQLAEVEACIAEATTDAERAECGYNDFLFSKTLVDAGIPVRFKTYSYRWNASYAIQMHSKYMVIDGNEVFSGSYNFSMNAEHATFENVVHTTGAAFKPLADAFEANFNQLWETNRAGGKLDALRTTISTAQTIPLTFEPISLTWQEVDRLRVLIRQHCTQVDSTDFRNNPGAHKTCPRL